MQHAQCCCEWSFGRYFEGYDKDCLSARTIRLGASHAGHLATKLCVLLAARCNKLKRKLRSIDFLQCLASKGYQPPWLVVASTDFVDDTPTEAGYYVEIMDAPTQAPVPAKSYW